MGNDVTIYTCLPRTTIKIDDTPPYSIVNFGRRFVLAGNPLCINLFFSLLKNYSKSDIIHAHSHLFISTLICAIVHRVKKFNLVITNHGLVSQAVPFWFQNLYLNTCGRFIFSSADALITYTKEEKATLVNLGIDSEKIHVIHNGIKVERFLTILDVPKKKQILWIGRYVPGKGAEYLVKGFGLFSQLHPEYSLLMIGNGPDKESIIQQIDDLALSDKISMVDFIPNEKLQVVYAESEIFISASLAEGVPKTILEAMVCGLSVISTDLPQLVDIVEGCGIIIPCRDPSAICHALEQITTDPQFMAQCGENGRNKVLSNYDWCDTVKKTNELFTELISS